MSLSLPTSIVEDDDATDKRPSTTYWRTTLCAGALVIVLVLATNIGALACVVHNYSLDSGVATVYTGPCEGKLKAIPLWIELAVNILSMLLLGASNNCSQLLSAPTRSEIDRAHLKARWLDIGVSSFRNLLHISPRRRLMWFALAFSSIPLHLFYNSIVFSTLSAIDYQAVLVTEDFLHGGYWNQTRVMNATAHNSAISVDQIVNMQSMIDNLTRLDNAACLKAYGVNMLESAWRNVLLVTSLTSKETLTQDSIVQIFEHQPDYRANDLLWPCDSRNTGSDLSTCDVQTLIANADSWTIPNATYCRENLFTCPPFAAPIKYCLAEPFEEACTVRVSAALLSVVIVFNVIKFVCLVSTASWRNFFPLATVGDAIVSFLEQPDAVTAGQGPMWAVEVWERAVWKVNARAGNYQAMPFQRTNLLWIRGVNGFRAAWCFTLCIAALIAAACLLGQGINASGYSSKGLAALWAEGLGTPSAFNTVFPSTRNGLIANILMANLPQLVLSFIYLFYNNYLTGMVLAHESAGYADKRNFLRVSSPTGHLRGTYWMHLPFVYSVPLLTAMALLHWLVSRSIFLLQVAVYDKTGIFAPSRAIAACGYSPIALLLAIFLGSAMLAVLIAMGFRRLAAGMPITGSCSVAIAACCHHAEEGAEMKALMYGVIKPEDCMRKEVREGIEVGQAEIDWESGQENSERTSRMRVGLSSKAVLPLVDGVLYR